MIAISGVDKIDFEQYDEVWYITNNNPNMRTGATHCRELAPFIGNYMKYRNNTIPLSSLLNQYGQDLWSGKYNEIINKLVELSESGKWIQLVCYCNNYKECHRDILYRYLKTFHDKVVNLDED